MALYRARRDEDEYYRQQPNAQLVRHADDIIILSDQPVEGALATLKTILLGLGLTLSEKKTRLARAEDGFDFLGEWTVPADRHRCGPLGVPVGLPGVGRAGGFVDAAICA